MKMKILCFVVLFVFIVSILGCTDSQLITGKATEKRSIEIGFIGPLTGFGAMMGQEMIKGADIALKEINSKGGINNKELKILYEDGQCLPNPAVTAARKLISINKVPIIIGPACSTSILPVAPLANQWKVPIIGTLDSSKDIAKAGDYVFTNGFSIENAAKIMADFAYNNLSIQTVTVLYDIDDWAQNLGTSFVTHFQKLGGKVLSIQKHNPESNDYKTELMKMKQLTPDAMYVIDIDLTGLVFKQARELGITTQFLAADNIGFGTVLQGAKQAVEGVYFSYQLKFDDKNKELFEFKQRYLKEYGKEPVNVLYAALGYDNVMLVAETLKNSGSDSDSIRIQLLETKDFKGIVGISDFDKNGVANRTQHINKVENGKFIAVN